MPGGAHANPHRSPVLGVSTLWLWDLTPSGIACMSAFLAHTVTEL